MSKRFLLFFLLLQFYYTVSGQLIKTDEREYQNYGSPSSVEFINLGSRGFLLINLQRGSTTPLQLRITRVDTKFKDKWVRFIPLKKRYKYYQYDTLANKVFGFSSIDPTYTDALAFSVEINTGETNIVQFKNILPIIIEEIKVVNKGSSVVMGGKFNRKPLATVISLQKKFARVLPGFNNDYTDLISIKNLPENNMFRIISTDGNSKLPGLRINEYEADGQLASTYFIPKENNVYPQNIIINEEGPVAFAAVTFGRKAGKVAEGIFIQSERKGKTIYHFDDFENYFTHYNTSKKFRIYNRISRKDIKNKHLRLNNKVNLRSIEYENGRYYVFLDSYYEKYKNMGVGSSGALLNNSSMIFDGYVITHTAVFCFNAKGDLLWDNVMKPGQNKSMIMVPIINYSVINDSAIMYFTKKDRLLFKVVNSKNSIKTNSKYPLKYESDKLVSPSNYTFQMMSWYDNKVISKGFISIKNKNVPNINLRRSVFSLSKFEYSSTKNGN